MGVERAAALQGSDPPPRLARDLLLLSALALLLRTFVAWSLPLDASRAVNECAPDERGHFLVIRSLAAGQAPVWPRDTQSIYAAFSPAPYFLHAAALAIGELGPEAPWLYRFAARTPETHGYLIGRAGSIVLGVATVLLLAGAAYAWSGSWPTARTTGLVAACYPQLVFVGAYSNADAFTIAAGAAVVLALARWARAGEGEDGLVLVALALGLVAVGKPSGYFLLVTTSVWVGWAALRGRVRLRAAWPAAGALAAVSGPILLWNAWRNDGDVLGLQKYAAWLASLRHPFTPGIEVPHALRLFVELLGLSSFGLYRNLDLRLPTALYVAALGFLAVGLAAATPRLARADARSRRGLAWLAASLALNLALVIYNCWFVGFSPQGRYILLSVVLLTAIAAAAPAASARAGPWQHWPRLYEAFLLGSALYSALLIYQHPCVD